MVAADAGLDDLEAHEALDVSAKLSEVLRRGAGAILLQSTIDDPLRQRRIERSARTVGHENERVATRAVVAPEHFPQHAASRVWTGGQDQRTTGRRQAGLNGVQDLDVRVGVGCVELALWNKDAGIDIEKEKGPWYKSIGQGMGAALNTASASNAYVLSDRGTWLSFKNKGDLVIAVEGDKRLFNQYGVMLVDPAKHPNVRKDLGQQFIDWLVSPEGQKAIANYKISGEQLFYPNANDPNA